MTLTGVAHASIVYQNVNLSLLVNDSLYHCLHALVVCDVQRQLVDVVFMEPFKRFKPPSSRVHGATLRRERFASAKIKPACQ